MAYEIFKNTKTSSSSKKKKNDEDDIFLKVSEYARKSAIGSEGGRSEGSPASDTIYKPNANGHLPSSYLRDFDRYTSDEQAKTPSNDFKASAPSLSVESDLDTTAKVESEKEDPNWGRVALGTLLKGSDMAATQISSTGAWLESGVLNLVGDVIGDEELYKKGLFYALDEKMKESKAINEEVFKKDFENAGKVGEAIDKYGVATVAAVPQAIIAMMTGGTSLAAQGSTQGLVAASTVAQGGLATTLSHTLKTMAKSPSYWASFAQGAGQSYEQAKADGANDLEASAYAVLGNLANAAVEIGGGIEALPSQLQAAARGGQSGLRLWVKSMLEEGKEEVVQGMISQLTQAVYGKNNELFSLTNTEAVVNPYRAADEFLGGVVVGGVLGAGQSGAVSLMNAAANHAYNRRIGKIGKDYADVEQEVIDRGLGFGEDTDAYRTAQDLQARVDGGEEISDFDRGKAVVANARAAHLERANMDQVSVEAEPVQSRVSVIQSRLAESGMDVAQAETVATSIDRILSGDTTITNADKNALSVGNNAARAIFESETGVKLPASNSATRKAVSEYVAQTALKQQKDAPVAVPQKETTTQTPAVATDTSSAEAVLRQAAQKSAEADAKAREAMLPQRDMNSIGENGQRVYQKHLGNAKSVPAYSAAFQRYYDAGMIGGLKFEEIETAYDGAVDRSVLYEAFIAGQNDVSSVDNGNVRTEKKSPQKGKKAPHKGKGKMYDMRTSAAATVDKRTIAALKQVSKVFGMDIELVDSIVNENGESYSNGYYDRSTNKILLAADSSNPLMVVVKHEITHYLQQTTPTQYKAFKDYVMKAYFNNSQERMNFEIQRRIDLAERNNVHLTRDGAMDEIVADATELFLTDRASIDALVQENRTLGQTILNAIRNVLNKIEAAMKGVKVDGKHSWFMDTDQLRQAEKMWVEALADAANEYNTFGVRPYAVDVSTSVQHSVRSLAEAAGFKAVRDENGIISLQRDGAKVSEVTVEDIDNSAIGALINFSLERGFISDADSLAQKKLFADLLTMAAKSNDFAMSMQFAGSAIFTAIKSNSDKQYNTTYDFPSICTKTQAVIDSMSAAMKAKRGGLTKAEIEHIYNEVFHDGNPVPCPECYVFSRWVGIGSLLDNIWTYQNKYAEMTRDEVQAQYLAMEEIIAKVAAENDLTLGKAKGKLASQFTKRYNDLYERVTKAENQGEKVSDKDRAELAVLKDNMELVKSMTWIDTVYFKDKAHKTANPKSKWFVPSEVLFDLNEGERFANDYSAAWGFRTTQGAGYGKAITPYAEAVLGEGILGTNSINSLQKGKKAGTLDNIFLSQKGTLDKAARKKLDAAIQKMNNQAFIGGQRFQSTSDARFENAFDYLIACLEVQAMHGMVQVYTKVAGAVPSFAAWGFSSNQSLMPKGSGLDAHGKPIDTAVGGMNPEVARSNRKKFDTQGTITIGVNDNHIRALMNQVWRDFIIPYHASGGDASLIQSFRNIQDSGNVDAVRSTDYTRTQGDKVLSDEVLRNYYHKTQEEIDLIHARRKARIDIFAMNLSGKRKANPDMDVVRGSRFLSALYDKLSEGGEWAGVTEPKSIIESQLFPNEYWDQTVTYDNSGKITRDYLEYCDELGILHRFSGMIPSNGTLIKSTGYDEHGDRVKLTDLAYNEDGSVNDFFWKVLTDRRMYDNAGNYLPQRRVSLSATQASDVESFAGTKQYGDKAGRQYDPVKSAETADRVAKEIAGDVQHSLKDRDYMKAVEDGDVAAQERMVAVAAREAGFTTKLYHGTQSFGFTKPRTSHVEAGYKWSPFWATPSNEMAQTYSGTRTIKRVSEKPKTYHARLLTDAQIREGLSSQGNFTKVTGRDNVQARVADAVQGWSNRALRQVHSHNEAKGYTDFTVPQAYYQALKMEMSPSKMAKLAELFTDEKVDAVWDKNAPAYYAAKYIAGYLSTDFGRAAYVSGMGDSTKVISQNDASVLAADALNANSNEGNYALYADTSGMLFIDCNGAYWNGIEHKAMGEGKYKTREIAEWAKKKGYTGVVFRNVRDSGPNGKPVGIGDAYAFFHPEHQIKSADPATYDSFGRVIPLSKRFNAKKNDIRYSLKVDTSDMDAEAKAIIKRLEDQTRYSRYGTRQYASYTADRIEREIAYSSSTKIDYAKSYIAWVDPLDFLHATTVSQQNRDHLEEEAGSLGIERLRSATQPIHLTVDFETGDIVGHEGRHRMIALSKDGVEKVAVIIDAWNDDRNNTKPVEIMRLNGQGFGQYRKGSGFYLHDALPLSARYADAATKLFSEVPKSVQFQLKTPDDVLDIAQQIAEAEHKAKAVTDAEIMSKAVKDIAKTEDEQKTVRDYQRAMKKLADYEKQLAVYEATEAEHSKGRSVYTDASGKIKKSGVKYSADEKAKIQQDINWWRNRLKEIEKREAFKKILKREKAAMAERHAKQISDLRAKYDARLTDLRKKRDDKVAAEKQRLRDYKQHQRDSKEYKKLKGKLESEVKWLSERLLSPTEAKHVPDKFRGLVAKFLETLDFTTERMDKNTAKTGEPSGKVIKLWSMLEEYQSIATGEDSDLVLTPIEQELYDAIKETFEGGKRVEDLEYNELEMVYDIVRYIKIGVAKANKAFNESIKESVSEMGDTLISEQRRKKARKDYAGIMGGVDKLLHYDNVSPADKFHRYGGVMETLYGEIRRGFDTHIENVRSAISYTQKLIEGHETDVKEWSGDKAKTTKFTISDGTTIELTPAQVMSLYALMKRDQAVGHVLGSGIVPSSVVVKEAKNFGKVKVDVAKKITAERASRCTIEDIQKIVGTLSADQKRIADGIVKLFTTKCADWGNETSMKLFDIKKFTEQHYFPIKSSDAYLNARFDDSGDVLIKNLGFTKNTVVNANNPIVIEDIFDVLADHTNKMSMYNALVVPLTDFSRVFNYKVRLDDGTVGDSVQMALEASGGKLGVQYVSQFIRDVNKQANSLAAESFINQAISRYKKAKIAASARVLLQQPTAITRAAAMVDPKYLVEGLKQKANYEEMFENSPIAYWKSLGFYQTDMGRNMKDILLGNESKLDQLTMGIYGKADDFAWGHLWNAIKLEQADAHPDMDTSSSEFMEAVGERFRDVIDRTQVVDSVFHRSQIMRAQGAATKVATAFMAEATKSFNLLTTDLYDSINSKDYSKIKRTAVTYVANAVLVSAFAAIADMIRDDDDEDDEGNKRNLWDKYRDAVAGNVVNNINPLNMIPYAKEVSSIVQGYESNRMEMAAITEFVKTAKKWTQGKYAAPYLLKETAEDFSELFGIPLKNAIRDVTALIRTAGDIVGGHYYADYMVDKMKYNISNSQNRSVFYKHYTDALLAGDDAAAEMILTDMVVNGIPYDNIISKGYQAEKNVAFSEARKLIANGKTDEAKSLIRKLAKKYDKKYTTLWKSVKEGDPANAPEETYDYNDLKKAVRKGEDTELIEDYLIDYGGYSEEAIEEAIKMLTEKYK